MTASTSNQFKCLPQILAALHEKVNQLSKCVWNLNFRLIEINDSTSTHGQGWLRVTSTGKTSSCNTVQPQAPLSDPS